MKSVENSDDELKKLAPKLSSIEKKEGFSVPANYFDSLPDQIMDKISAAPVLGEEAVLNPFVTPENYFEELPFQISNRIAAAEAKRFSLAALLAQVLRPKYSLSLITSCLVLIICIRYFEKPIMINLSQMTDSISISESDVISEVDEGTLTNAVYEESATLLKNNKPESTATKSMEDYILNNNIDLSDVAKEL